MKAHNKKLIITGANGFIGSALVNRALEEGWQVRGLVRDLKEVDTSLPVSWHEWSFLEPIPEEALYDTPDVLIHAAYEMRPNDSKKAAKINVEGSLRLFEEARTHGISKIVFLSSMSAHEGALSWYGKTKRHLEQQLSREKDLVIRAGLVIGNGGLFKRMASAIRKTGLAPVFFGGNQKIQTIAVEDLSYGIMKAVEKGLSGTLYLAEPNAHTLEEFYRSIGAVCNRRVRVIPLPGGLTLFFLRVCEKLRISLPITSENLLGLKALRAEKIERDIEKIGVQPKSMYSALEAYAKTYESKRA